MRREQASLRVYYTNECPDGVNPVRWHGILRHFSISLEGLCPICMKAVKPTTGATVYHMSCLEKQMRDLRDNRDEERCERCFYRHFERDGGWCYMFKERTKGVCGQFKHHMPAPLDKLRDQIVAKQTRLNTI